MATTANEVWQLLGELIQSPKETERLLQEQSQESDRHFQETVKTLGILLSIYSWSNW
jgi:hypothetical protein